MAIPALPYLAGLWTQSKWIVILGALIGSHYFAYSKGRESILREQTSEVSTPRITEATQQAVTRASDHTKKLKELEVQNEKLLKQLDAMERTKCPLSADELRLLDEIQKSTQPR